MGLCSKSGKCHDTKFEYLMDIYYLMPNFLMMGMGENKILFIVKRKIIYIKKHIILKNVLCSQKTYLVLKKRT